MQHKPGKKSTWKENPYLLNEILDSISDGVLSLNREWTFTYINQRAASNIGFKPEELIGQNLWEKFPKILGTDHEVYYRKAMAEQQIQHFQIRGVLTNRQYGITVYPSSQGINVHWHDNTERKKAQEELAKIKDELEIKVKERTANLVKVSEELQLKATILDKASDAILLREIDNIIVYANEAAGKILGYGTDELIGMNFRSLVPPQELPGFEERFKTLINERVKSIEAYNLRKDGSLVPVEVHFHHIKIGQRRYILSVMRDITNRKRAEEKLKQSETSLRLILKQIPCVLWTMDRKLRFTSITGVGLKDSNLRTDQLLGMELTKYVKDSSPENVTVKAHLNALSGITSNFEMNEKDTGRTFHAYVEPLRDAEENIIGIIGISLDITEQKRLRDEKERFTKKLIEVQEEERKRLSRDLHDEIAQYLALLTLEMDNLIVKGEKLSPELFVSLRKLKDNAETALQEVRRYSHELRPSVLEHFGLTEALELIIGEFNERNNIEVGFEISGEGTRLKEEVELVFFRIVQEALNNIRKHSEATKVEIRLRYLSDKVRLMITDNGRGFEVSKKGIPCTLGGLGLVSMRERANLIGATLKVSSDVGKGTMISVEAPLERNLNKEFQG